MHVHGEIRAGQHGGQELDQQGDVRALRTAGGRHRALQRHGGIGRRAAVGIERPGVGNGPAFGSGGDERYARHHRACLIDDQGRRVLARGGEGDRVGAKDFPPAAPGRHVWRRIRRGEGEKAAERDVLDRMTEHSDGVGTRDRH